MKGSVSAPAARDRLVASYPSERRRAVGRLVAERRIGRFMQDGKDLRVELRLDRFSGRYGVGAVLRGELGAGSGGCRLKGRIHPNRIYQGAYLGLAALCVLGIVFVVVFVVASDDKSGDPAALVALWDVLAIVLFGAMAALLGWTALRPRNRAIDRLLGECRRAIEADETGIR